VSLLKTRKSSARLRPLLPAVVALSPVVLCLAFQSAGARPAFSEAAPPRSPLAFHQYMVNLGEVESRRVHDARFWMTNGGTDILEIRDVTTSCGCLSDQIEKKIVQPGETSDLTLYIRAANQASGAKHYTARISYGPVGDPETEFETEVAFRLVLPEQTVTLNPRVLIMHQYEGDRVSHVVDVNDLRDHPLTVLDVSCEADFIDVELIPESEMAPASRRNGLVAKIRVTATSVPPGPHECVVRIRTTDSEFADMTLPMRIYGPHTGVQAELPSPDRIR
jgi:hypothetical protein